MTDGLQPTMTWAEDRAPVKTDPSADPGPRPQGERRLIAVARSASTPAGSAQSAKPSRYEAAIPRHDAFRQPLTSAAEIPVHAEPGHPRATGSNAAQASYIPVDR